MIENDVCIGKPLVAYSDTKANIEALAGLTAGSMGYASDTHAPGWLIDDTWSWLDITKGKTLTVTGSPTLAGDATLTLTTALTNNTGAGVLTWPAGGATLTIAGTGTAITGTGTANYLSKWSATNTQANSLIRDDGTTLGIGAAPSATYYLNIYNMFNSASLVYGTQWDFRNSGGPIYAGTMKVRSVNTATTSVRGLEFAAGVQASTAPASLSVEAAGFVGRIFVSAAAGFTASIAFGKAIVADSPQWFAAGGTESMVNAAGVYINNQGHANISGDTHGIYIADQSGAGGNEYSIYTNAGNITLNAGLADAADFLLNGTTYALIQTDSSDDELYLCNNAAAKLSFFAVAPIVQPANTTAIDTLIANLGLRAAGGIANFASTVRSTTASYRRYHHISLGSANPGGSGATWINPSATTSGGWNITSASHILRGTSDIHSDWDGASDMTFEIRFAVNVDNSGGADADTVDLKATFYYKGIGDTAAKSQVVEVATIVGKSARYKQFGVSFTIDYDYAGNVVDAGDLISVVLNLETDTSEVDDIVVSEMTFHYNTAHVGIESGDT